MTVLADGQQRFAVDGDRHGSIQGKPAMGRPARRGPCGGLHDEPSGADEPGAVIAHGPRQESPERLPTEAVRAGDDPGRAGRRDDDDRVESAVIVAFSR